MNERVVRAVLELPPTSNNIYFNQPGGGRSLTTEARSWKRRAIGEVVRQGKIGLQEAFDYERKYWLELHFFFEAVINKGWNEFYKRGPKKGQRKAQSKWKKMDLSNRVKLVEDAVKGATGVDDSCTFAHFLLKDCDPDNPRVEVALFTIKED